MKPLAKKKAVKQTQTLQFPDKFRIVAADQSQKRPGFCKVTVEKTENGLVFSDFETTNVNNKAKTKPHGQQLDEVLQAMAFFFPDSEKDPIKSYYVREKAALSSFAQAMIGQAKMAGMADWVQWRIKEEWHEITANAIKKQVTGDGSAEKADVAAALEQYLGPHEYACDDESDAAAVAIAFLISHELQKPAEKVEKVKKGVDLQATPEKEE